MEDNADEVFFPQVSFELMERKMPREKYPLKNMEDDLNLYEIEKVPKEGLRKRERKRSLDIQPTSKHKLLNRWNILKRNE